MAPAVPCPPAVPGGRLHCDRMHWALPGTDAFKLSRKEGAAATGSGEGEKPLRPRPHQRKVGCEEARDQRGLHTLLSGSRCSSAVFVYHFNKSDEWSSRCLVGRPLVELGFGRTLGFRRSCSSYAVTRGHSWASSLHFGLHLDSTSRHPASRTQEPKHEAPCWCVPCGAHSPCPMGSTHVLVESGRLLPHHLPPGVHPHSPMLRLPTRAG
ncbi:hypothetical protein R6Z07F_018099 [Ovis aries]